MSKRVDYDRIAPTYDQRFSAYEPEGIVKALQALAQEVRAERILEVGCGTGHWLAQLRPLSQRVYGLDLSRGMLQQARQERDLRCLVCGDAGRLPFADTALDLILCVHAIHHFEQPRAFVSQARRVLRSGGALAIVGMDPHYGRDRWYLYDYFPGTRETDLRRVPSKGTILDWMIEAGFEQVEWRPVQRIVRDLVGREVLDSPFLQRYGTSQLALLTDAAYAAGMERLRADLSTAEAKGEELVLSVDISLSMLSGHSG